MDLRRFGLKLLMLSF